MHRTAFRETVSFKLPYFNEMGIIQIQHLLRDFLVKKGPRSRKISTETMEVGAEEF